MKIVCSWCGMVLKKGSGETDPDTGEDVVSHSICLTCYNREVKDIKAKPHRKDGGFKPPPPDFDWLEFLHGQMIFSLTLGTLFLLIVLAAEDLHRISGGKIPALIEWHSQNSTGRGSPSDR